MTDVSRQAREADGSLAHMRWANQAVLTIFEYNNYESNHQKQQNKTLGVVALHCNMM